MTRTRSRFRSRSIRSAVLAAVVVVSIVGFATAGVSAAGATQVALEPSSQQVSPGGTVTVPVVLQSADGGVGAFDAVRVTVDDPSVARITDISTSVAAGPETSVASDGSSASVTVPFGGDTADSGAVTIATVTLEARSAGTAGLSVDVTGDISDEGGSLYTVTGTSGASVTVGDGGGDDQPPTAAFGWSPSTPTAGDSVTFDAGESSDDGTIETYEWDFDGDGTTDATGETTSHAFSSAGDHDVTLTVTDDGDNSASTTETVTVDPDSSDGGGDDNGVSTSRSLGSSQVLAGNTMTVTTSVTTVNPIDRLALAERFSPGFSSVSIDSVSIVGGGGQTVTRLSNANGVDVAIESIDAGTTIEVSYEVMVADDASPGRSYSIEGYAIAAGNNVSIAEDTVTVVESTLAQYANDNGVIDTSGLRGAISDWALGDVDTQTLRTVIQKWATGESVV